MDRETIYDAIDRERAYQDAKWGTPEEHPHELPGWLLVMRKELVEAEDAWVKGPHDAHVLREILQVVSVGIAALEQYGVIERESFNNHL